MMLKEKIQIQIDEFLKQRPDLFLIKYHLSPTNEAEVVIDGDKGVCISDCVALNRMIENNVDREQEDYALRVSSYGLTQPLIDARQYKKNLGKKIEVNTKDSQNYKGTIVKAEKDAVELQWKARVPKEVGKGKVTKSFNKVIKYSDMSQAKIVLTF